MMDDRRGSDAGNAAAAPGERHVWLSREVAVERCRQQPKYNAPYADALDPVTGMLTYEGHDEPAAKRRTESEGSG